MARLDVSSSPSAAQASRAVPGVAAGEPPLWLPTPGSLLAGRLRLAQVTLAVGVLAVLSAANSKAESVVFGTYVIFLSPPPLPRYLLPAAWLQCGWLLAATAVELLVLRRRSKQQPAPAGRWILRAMVALDSLTLAATFLGGSADLSMAWFIAVDNCFDGPERCAAIRGELPRAALAWIALVGPAGLVFFAHILQYPLWGRGAALWQ